MSYFNEDPWEKCSLGSYPAGVRFSEYDARFRVSKDSAGSVILFIHEDEKLLVSDLFKVSYGIPNISCLLISIL